LDRPPRTFDYQYSQYNTNYRQNTINPNFNIPLTYVAKENPMRKVFKTITANAAEIPTKTVDKDKRVSMDRKSYYGF
jgi:hypothetical protein